MFLAWSQLPSVQSAGHEDGVVEEKIETNRARDDRAIGALLNLGWRVMIVWECAIKGRTRRDRDEIVEMMKRWLLSETRTCEILGRNEVE